MENSESPETKRIHAFQLVAEKIEGFQVGSFFFLSFFYEANRGKADVGLYCLLRSVCEYVG